MVFIKQDFQGKGFGRDVVEKINYFLDSKNKPGLLLDSISEDAKPKGIYERHGWIKIPDKKDWYGYHLPNLEAGQVEKAIYITRKRLYNEKPKSLL